MNIIEKIIFFISCFIQSYIKKRPIVLSHSITPKCNLSCCFCDQIGSNKTEKKDLNQYSICQIIYFAYKFGIKYYNVWSAEPFMRNDLEKILKHAKSYGLKTMVITNGTLIQKNISVFRYIDYLSISFDGPTVSSKIKNINYNQLIHNIKCAKKLIKSKILINCVIGSLNLKEIDNIIKLSKELDLKLSIEPIHKFKKDNINNNDSIYISEKELPSFRSIVRNIIKYKQNKYPIINSFTYLNYLINKKKIKCNISRNILSIDKNGYLYTCRSFNNKLKNVLTCDGKSNSLENAWILSKDIMFNINSKCNGCYFFGYIETNLLYNYNINSFIYYDFL